jgi:hypothetical protein
MKANWVCSICGMYSNRKSSVKRHIINLHNGEASLVSFIEYMVGRTSGLYSKPKQSSSGPPLFSFIPPLITENQNKEKKTSVEIFEEEFMKEKARIAAKNDKGINFSF